MKPNTPEADKLIQDFERAGQGQVFRFFPELTPAGREQLLSRAATIDLEEVNALVEEHLRGEEAEAVDYAGLAPAPYIPLPEHDGDPDRWESARRAGESAIRAGRVAAFTVAGGQGTRLGFDGPKGTFPVTPITGKSLFQVFAGKIARTSERYGAPIHWFILTSEINHAPTVAAFREHGFFGLPEDRVRFIVQGLVPAVDYQGEILLADTSTIAMTPDGHGGALRALVRGGAVDTMADLGIDCLSYFQVDNPLVPCLDPAFVGFHLQAGSELSSKMVPKAYPMEKVGHFCVDNGRLVVVEYSDLPEDMQKQLDEHGRLRFNAGSVAIHVFDREFIRRVGGGDTDDKLPFHRADKKIPHVDAKGDPVEPERPNGVKFEMFVFDALPMARDPVIIEGDRREEFSPVKNADGKDSPQTCKEDQLRMFAGWLKAAGGDIETDPSGLPGATFEISPRFAADKRDFVERWRELDRKLDIRNGLVLE